MEPCREPRVGDGPSDEGTVVSGTRGQWCREGCLDQGSDLGDLPQGRGWETLPDFLLHAALETLRKVCTGRRLKRWVRQEGLARLFTPPCCSHLNLLWPALLGTTDQVSALGCEPPPGGLPCSSPGWAPRTGLGVGEKVGLDSSESGSCSQKCPLRTGKQGGVEWEPPFQPAVGPLCSGPCCREGWGGAGRREQAGRAEPWGRFWLHPCIWSGCLSQMTLNVLGWDPGVLRRITPEGLGVTAPGERAADGLGAPPTPASALIFSTPIFSLFPL